MTWVRCLGKGTMLDPHRFEINGVPRKDVYAVALEREPDSYDLLDPSSLRIADFPSPRFVLSVNGNPVIGDWEVIEEAKNLRYLYRDGTLTIYAPDLAQGVDS